MSDSIRSNIQVFHEDNISWSTRTIKIFGEIDFDMKSIVISNLHLLDSTTGTVTILLSSGGGCVSSGLDIIDAIRAMKNEVRIIAYGEVGSMASVIFQAADINNRYMMPNSYLMIHEGEGELVGNLKNRTEWKRLMDYQENICLDLYLSKIKEKKPRFTKQKLINYLDRDRILLPKEAIDIGLADSILEVY